jgi:hypothetical protein
LNKVKDSLFHDGRRQSRISDVSLPSKPETWDTVVALLEAIPNSEKNGWLKDRKDAPPLKRDLF